MMVDYVQEMTVKVSCIVSMVNMDRLSVCLSFLSFFFFLCVVCVVFWGFFV